MTSPPDIVERLRAGACYLDDQRAAADEIEQLRAENRRLRREEAIQWRDWQTVEAIDAEEDR